MRTFKTIITLSIFCLIFSFDSWASISSGVSVKKQSTMIKKSGLAGKTLQDGLVRIRIKKAITEWTLSALGQIEFLKTDVSGRKIYQNLFRSKSNFSKIKIQRSARGWVLTRDQEKVEIQQKQLILKSSDIVSMAKPVPSVLLFYPNMVGFDVVGYEDMNEYLAGVVSSEMPPEWPLEALKAQVVVAKSYLKATQRERVQSHFDVENSVMDQVFNKVNWLHNSKYKNVVKAIRDTQDLVLTSQNKIVKSFYHSDCGGLTTTSAQVWGVKDQSQPVKDHFCPLNPKSSWTYQISKEQFNQNLSEYLQIEQTNIHEVKFLRDEQKQRVLKLQVTLLKPNMQKTINDDKSSDWKSVNGSKGVDAQDNLNQEQQIYIAGDKLREIFGYNVLRSLLFEVSESQGDLVFKGQGFGHGVGLCQWGTKRRAELGDSFENILKHYYPNVSLTSLQELSSQKKR